MASPAKPIRPGVVIDIGRAGLVVVLAAERLGHPLEARWRIRRLSDGGEETVIVNGAWVTDTDFDAFTSEG